MNYYFVAKDKTGGFVRQFTSEEIIRLFNDGKLSGDYFVTESLGPSFEQVIAMGAKWVRVADFGINDPLFKLKSATSSSQNRVSQDASKESPRIINRYTDAYLVAKVTIGVGTVIKAIGVILAVVIFLSSLLFAGSASQQPGINSASVSTGVFLVPLVLGGLSAFIVGFIFYVAGVLVTANGQILRATLDNTVGNSPFLTEDLKAKIMSLSD